MRTILVTGGAGFIGSHTCVRLLEMNYKVIILDSFINSNYAVIKQIINIAKGKKEIFNDRVKLIVGDIRDEVLLNNVFKSCALNKYPIDAVIHFAGLKSVKESVKFPDKYWEVNVLGSQKLYKAMRKFNCFNLVFSSTAMIYGYTNDYFLKEDSAIKPNNPYGISKYEVEKFLFANFKQGGEECKIINLRYFNPIGAHSSGLIGEDPSGDPNNLFPIINEVATRKREFLNIFGDNWPTPDGTGVRDYIHVMDLADAHIAALLKCFNSESLFLSLNIGTGTGTSVLELVKEFEKANKINIPIVYKNRREGDVPILVAKNDLALSVLNWIPKRSLREMCKDGWLWKLKNPDGYKINQ